MATQQKKDIIKFVSNEAVTVTLDTEPTNAKSNTRDTQWGPKTSFTYFTGDGRVMFPSEVLHDKLLRYSKGDTVTITLVDGKQWLVTSATAVAKKSIASPIDRVLENTETTILLRKIASDIDLIKGHIFGVNTNVKPNETKETTKEEDDNDIDF